MFLVKIHKQGSYYYNYSNVAKESPATWGFQRSPAKDWPKEQVLSNMSWHSPKSSTIPTLYSSARRKVPVHYLPQRDSVNRFYTTFFAILTHLDPLFRCLCFCAYGFDFAEIFAYVKNSAVSLKKVYEGTHRYLYWNFKEV